MIVTVVIPCRNEVNSISDCITAIYSNKRNVISEIEIVVVDGISDDGTLELLNELQPTFPTLKVVRNVAKVTPVAFNLGIRAARGQYIQIIGARQIISDNYLETAVKVLEANKNIWCVGGRVENIFENKTAERVAMAMSSSFGVGGGNFRTVTKTSLVDTVGTPMYPSWVFDKIGYFDESLVRNQDDDFNYRVTQAGGEIQLNAEIIIKYFVRSSFSKLYRQYFQYGYWKVYVNKKHKTVTSIRQLIPFGFIMFLISLPFWVFMGIVPMYTILLAIYLALSIYFGVKVSKTAVELPFIMFIFTLLHISYGLGYGNGILDFLILNKQPSKSNKRLSR